MMLPGITLARNLLPGVRSWRRLVGMGIGALAASALAQLARTQIFGVGPFDPGTLLVAFLLMSLTAIVAVSLPARRAARVDPVLALRGER